MPRYDRRCKGAEPHECEYAFSTFKAVDEALAAGIACAMCGAPTELVINSAPAVRYNAAGFYGNVPTADAHASGLV